jgi:hypothetical protein
MAAFVHEAAASQAADVRLNLPQSCPCAGPEELSGGWGKQTLIMRRVSCLTTEPLPKQIGGGAVVHDQNADIHAAASAIVDP